MAARLLARSSSSCLCIEVKLSVAAITFLLSRSPRPALVQKGVRQEPRANLLALAHATTGGRSRCRGRSRNRTSRKISTCSTSRSATRKCAAFPRCENGTSASPIRPSGRRNGMSRRSTERPPGTDMPVFHPVNLRRRSLLRIEIHQHSIISRGINVGSRGVNACLVVPTRGGRRASGPQRSRGLLGFSSRERHSERLPARCTPQATKTVSLPVNSTGRTEARPHATRRNARGRHGIPLKIKREEEVMSKLGLSRRTFVQGSVGLTVANFVPGMTPLAFAATMEEQTVAAAKTVGKADVSGMIWSPYFVPMQPVIAEFTKQTGIGIGGIQDISIFDAPQRAMAEALSRSPQFDFIHIDSNMIPSLVSAGYLEPLDEYIEKAGFHLDVVADYGNFMKYGGHTYGVPTDGNVHIQYTRKDLLDNPDNKKRFADKFGTELKLPETWEENLRLQEFLMEPKTDLYGSGNLRNRANGVTWWYMIFYSAGGFPFDDDMKPTLNTPAGQYA